MTRACRSFSSSPCRSAARATASGPDRDAALQRPGQVIERGLTIDIGKAAPRRKPSPNTEVKKRLKAAEAAWRERQKQMASEAADLQRRLANLQDQQADLAAAHAEERLETETQITALRAKAQPSA